MKTEKGYQKWHKNIQQKKIKILTQTFHNKTIKNEISLKNYFHFPTLIL